jgi:hypothetical protein
MSEREGGVDLGPLLSKVWQPVAAAGRAVGGALGSAGAWSGIYILPQLLRIIFVVVFVFAGLKELYYSNATFGEDWVLDYGALFLWGIAATGVNAALGKVIPGATTKES